MMWAFTFTGNVHKNVPYIKNISMDLRGTNMSALPSEVKAAISFFLPF